jgi:hypothetical protein
MKHKKVDFKKLGNALDQKPNGIPPDGEARMDE